MSDARNPKRSKVSAWGPYPASRKPPTKKHRPAIWECMLGAVYAMNEDGEARYFDYDYEAAHEFAGVNVEGRDPRVAKMPEPLSYVKRGLPPRSNQLILWITKEVA